MNKLTSQFIQWIKNFTKELDFEYLPDSIRLNDGFKKLSESQKNSILDVLKSFYLGEEISIVDIVDLNLALDLYTRLLNDIDKCYFALKIENLKKHYDI